MGEVIIARPNKYARLLAERAVNDATKITIGMNNLQKALLDIQVLNINHDVGAQRIEEILPMFISARNDFLENARKLIRGK